MQIYDGPTDSNPKLGTSPSFCGSTSPGLLTSTRSQVFIKFYSDSRTSTGSSGFAATFSRKAPECITRTNLPGSGVITSPGFPRPFPLAATCTWEITIPRSSLIDFTFHTIELGPDNEDILDCGNTRVKTVVSLYEVGIGDTETLLVR
ncbi:hypothetical protein V1264_008493 [Littorina saxatilis]|uniref:CUB domain-containing protein n=1 Tax=Littorina saxatilis TaxID=31220 RepID=A0AAN9AT72_9CAEN